jgi:glycosyltransferase involved in cell wall biosynthesis
MQSHFLGEVASKVDQSRLHFVGHLSHRNYIRALQLSSAHIYLTYPFILSWSLLEAMSTGCLVIGSDTPPVREVVDGTNGLLVSFFDKEALAQSVIDVLADSRHFEGHRNRARETILARYDMKHVCLPQMLSFLGFSKTKSDSRPHRALHSERV